MHFVQFLNSYMYYITADIIYTDFIILIAHKYTTITVWCS